MFSFLFAGLISQGHDKGRFISIAYSGDHCACYWLWSVSHCAMFFVLFIMTSQRLKSTHHKDVIIIGAGAAGLICAGQAAFGQSAMVIDHRQKPAEKDPHLWGGRCNFTNIYSTHENFLSRNPHFAKSALAGYSPCFLIDLVTRHKIAAS